MISSIFHAIVYNPLYNGLIYIIDHVPGGDIGWSVILFTCLVKIILFPLSKVSVRTQIQMRELQPQLNKIQEQYKDNKEIQAKKTLEFYRENKLNPFSGIFLMLIQLPIILALAYIFYYGGLPKVDASVLYSFVQVPDFVNNMFLGLIDISKSSKVLAVLAGVSQFISIRLSVPPHVPTSDTPNFKDDLAKSMNTQMRYVMPAFVFFISLGVSGAVALYWITSNIFTIGQEIYFRGNIKKSK